MILSIETSGLTCSIAVHQEGELVGCMEYRHDKAHSKLLTLSIQQLLANLATTVNKLEAVAISAGPGSYTGLRIGTSVAKGLCFAAEKPLIAINTLKIMAFSVKDFVPSSSWICPMLDARRMEVYTAIYTTDLREELTTRPLVIEEGSYAQYTKNRETVFFGNGAKKAKEVIGGQQNVVFLAKEVRPTAKGMGELALEKYSTQTFEDLTYFEPNYIKSFKGVKVNKSLR